jgi:hypothetical protein
LKTTDHATSGILFLFSVLYLYFFFLIVLVLPFVLTVQHTTQTSVPRAGFVPATPVSDRPQTLALDRTATIFGPFSYFVVKVFNTHAVVRNLPKFTVL